MPISAFHSTKSTAHDGRCVLFYSVETTQTLSKMKSLKQWSRIRGPDFQKLKFKTYEPLNPVGQVVDAAGPKNLQRSRPEIDLVPIRPPKTRRNRVQVRVRTSKGRGASPVGRIGRRDFQFLPSICGKDMRWVPPSQSLTHSWTASRNAGAVFMSSNQKTPVLCKVQKPVNRLSCVWLYVNAIGYYGFAVFKQFVATTYPCLPPYIRP